MSVEWLAQFANTVFWIFVAMYFGYRMGRRSTAPKRWEK